MPDLVLPQSGILSDLDQEHLEILTTFGIQYPFQANQTIIEQNTPQNALFMVLTGSLQVIAEVSGKDVPLAEIAPGECFGEVSIFEPGPASATVKGLVSGQLWQTDVDNLQAFLEGYPQGGLILLLGIDRMLSRRLRTANEVLKRNKVNPGFLSVRTKLKKLTR
jgi:CRP-like cAMP-binding protein